MAYSTRTDTEQIVGVENLKEWLDLDRDANTTTIASRSTYLGVLADAIIDGKLSTSPYAVPVEAPTATTTPTVIKMVSAILRGVLAIEAMGIEDYNPQSGRPVHKLSAMREWALQILDDVSEGRLKLDAKGKY